LAAREGDCLQPLNSSVSHCGICSPEKLRDRRPCRCDTQTERV